MALRTPSNNRELKAFIDSKTWYRKPKPIREGTRKAYGSLGFHVHGYEPRDDYLYTVALIYQQTMAKNHAQLARDKQANFELQSALSFIRSLRTVDDFMVLKVQAAMALQMLKRVIQTCELESGFLAQLFPGWCSVQAVQPAT